MPKYLVGSTVLGLIVSFIGLNFTTSTNIYAAGWNTRLYEIIALANCVFATYIVIWLTRRF